MFWPDFHSKLEEYRVTLLQMRRGRDGMDRAHGNEKRGQKRQVRLYCVSRAPVSSSRPISGNQKECVVPQATDHERNDRIEASVMMAALATLGLLVALAVSTSISDVSSLHAEAPQDGPDPARQITGIEETGSELQGSELN